MPRAVWRRCLLRAPGAVLGIFLLILQALMPIEGQAATNTVWIEICGDYGPVTIQVTADGNALAQPEANLPAEYQAYSTEPSTIQVPANSPAQAPTHAPDCPECDVCALCSIGDATMVSRASHFALYVTTDLSSCGHGSRHIVRNPAQFWPDSRGPPREKDIFTTRMAHQGLASIPKTGEAPCS